MLRATQRLIPSFVFALLFGCVLEAVAAEETANAQGNEKVEIWKKISKLSEKVNGQPEIRKLKEDFESAQKAYQTAFAAAMTKEDAEVMSAYRSWREDATNRFQNPASRVLKTKEASGYDTLTDGEKKRFFEARKQAGDAPSVKDARLKRNAAKTEDERKSAEAEYKTELRKSMLATESELEPLLDKLEGKKKPPEDANKH